MITTDLLSAAESAHQKGELEQAEKAYTSILEQEDNVDALFGLATLCHQTKRFAQANLLFSQALTHEPNAFDINFNALLCLVSSGELSLAKTKFAFVLTIAPKQATIFEQLASIAVRLNLAEQALALLAQVRALSPHGKTTQLQALMQMQQWGKALLTSQDLISEHPNDVKQLSFHAICQVKMQLYPQAVQTYQHLVKLLPNNGLLHVKFADLYLLIHESALAREQLNVAIALNEQSLMRYEVECKVCRIENNKKQAFAAAKKALKIKPEAEFAWHVLQDLGDEAQRQTCIQELSQLTASTETYSYDLQHNLYTLAHAHQAAGEYKDAFVNFDKANKLQAKHLASKSTKRTTDQSASKHHERAQIENDYKKLKGIPYPVEPIKNTKVANCQNVFIVGMPRSGTTLTNRVFTQQIDFESCGESNAIATLFESMLLNANESEHAIATKLVQSRAESQRFYREFNRSSLPNVVDKMPHNFRYVGAILAAFPHCRVIQMRRELGDLALSIYSNFFNQQHTYACNLEDIAHAIYHANEMMDFWAKAYPTQVIDVNYEQLVTAPQEQFKSLFEFCGFAWDDMYLDFHKKVVASFTFSETQVRQPINTSKIGFSKHYDKQLSVLYETYERLSNIK